MKKNLSVKELLKFDLPHNEQSLFHQKTKIKKGGVLAFSRYPKSWTTLVYKGYSRFKEILFPKPRLSDTVSLLSVLQKRKSNREFKKIKLPLNEISALCYYSFGLKKKDDPGKFRFYPSAGARFPVEIYIVSLNTDLERGVYHYYPKHNSLEKLLSLKSISFKEYGIPSAFKSAGLLIIMTGVFERGKDKYGVRSYPLMLLEAGHIGQNIYLVSSALSLVCCAIGGFDHYGIDTLLDIDGVNESSIYMFAVGSKR